MREVIVSLILSLGLTIVLEAGLFLGLFWLRGKRCKRDLVLVVLVNVLTNPAVVTFYWFVTLYTNWNIVAVVIPLEILAVLTEGYCYGKYGQCFKRPYLFSVAANVFSFGTGILINCLF